MHVSLIDLDLIFLLKKTNKIDIHFKKENNYKIDKQVERKKNYKLEIFRKIKIFLKNLMTIEHLFSLKTIKSG